MEVLSDSDIVLDVDPDKVVQNFSSKERLRRFGVESAEDYQQNIEKFHSETITKLYALAKSFIDSLTYNWSLFPSTLRWLVQTMSHQLKQAHFSDKIINEIITDMVFTHFICPAIVSPDLLGIVDVSVSEQVRFNLIQIGQIVQMLALAKHEDVDSKFAAVHAKFDANMVTNLIDLLLVSQSGEDVVAILSQQSDFDRAHLLSTQHELGCFVEFFRMLIVSDEYDVSMEERQKLKKILAHLPESKEALQRLQGVNGSESNVTGAGGTAETHTKEHRSKQSFMSLGKATKSKIAKSMSFSTNSSHGATSTGENGAAVVGASGAATAGNSVAAAVNGNNLVNGATHHSFGQAPLAITAETAGNSLANSSTTSVSSTNSSPLRHLPQLENNGGEAEPVLVFRIYNSDENKLQPLTEEEVLKMNSIGQEIVNGDALLVDGSGCNLENGMDKSSSVANGYDALDGISDVLRPLHKTTRFSLSHDDASIGNSDNLEAVSEAPSNHSVTSSLELEENDQNDNLSDMVSANVSGRGSPNISGRDTPSSQVTDGESVANALPTPQMQKLISKARSDIEDKFCKFEIKKFEGDETVSIISDTWSTDVLASDSETLDAIERERDRNFATPLIPSAVVLPGDNNFDALAGTGTIRPSYLDASDQRSESNWSTDVLASDSEKLAEVDTDDNMSITARSDIMDSAGTRSDRERSALAAAVSASAEQRAERAKRITIVSPGYAQRAGAGISGVRSDRCGRGDRVDRAFHAATSPNYSGVSNHVGDGGHGSGGSSGGNASDRSQEDTAFYDALTFYENGPTTSAAAAVGAAAEAASNGVIDIAGLLASPAAIHHYQSRLSLARSSARTTNQYSGEYSFQQNYKSIISSGEAGGSSAAARANERNDGGASSKDAATFLSTPRMRRQTSAESSISNQSLNLDEAAASTVEKPPKAHHKSAAKKKKNQHGSHNHHNKKSSIQSNESSKDLIDFSDFGEEKPVVAVIRTDDPFAELFNNEEIGVEHRRLSVEQRSAGFDGRRNGIMALKGGGEPAASSRSGTSMPPALRRHQSLNYENHEIMISTAIPSRMSVVPNAVSDKQDQPDAGEARPQTDDDKRNEQQQKQQEILQLCAKTEELQLNDDGGGGDDVFNGAAAAAADDATQSNVSTGTGIMVVTMNAALPSLLSSSQAKPTKATGAIPKSISFDASADKNSSSNSSTPRPMSHRGVRMHEALRHPGGGGGGGGGANSSIFNKLKQGLFKHRRNNKSQRALSAADDFSHSSRSVSFSTNASEVSSLDLMSAGGIGIGASAGRHGASSMGGYCDITEDILAKYRRKVSTSSEATTSDSIGGNGGGGGAGGVGFANQKTINVETNRLSNATLLHDKTVAFNIMKKKIRTVLSKTDLHTGDFRHTTFSNVSPLLTYLQIQLAQAINLQNFQQISYVSEAIRCIRSLDAPQHSQLLEELQNDIQKRQNYLQYLMRYRQNLLLMLENIGQCELRLRGESTTCNRYLIAACVRLFLEKRQSKIDAFQAEFAHLTVSDDKVDLIEEFIDALMEELLSSGGLLHGMPEWQVQEARNSIEHILLQRMYQQVMFPNEDADLSRDTVLSEHIRKLQAVIRPSHPALCIPQEYLSEAPWTFAQQQLTYISAYKTPREKLQCVIRCISSIMSLLHMSSGRVPAADDLLPVLIYVVIMANPPYLLSTVEYITCFIGEKLDGEEQFHWTLFGSVVKFIKTMDYLD